MRSLSRLSLAVAAILSLVGTGLTWTIYRTEVAGQQAEFDILAQRAARRIEIRIEQHLALLTATRAFLEVHPRAFEREVFAAFVSKLDLDGQYSGLQGIGISQLLPPASEASIEAGIRTNYDLTLDVWPEAVPGLRTAIVLPEPSDVRNRAALGFDMSTEAHRRTAMLQALAPNEKWLTDITEFHIRAGKVYLSPIIDCFDGMVISWAIGTKPDAGLANTMLDAALETIADS